MIEYKYTENLYIESLLSSKIWDRSLKKSKVFNLFFVGKNRNKIQVIFLFVILSLLLDKTPILCSKKRGNKQKPQFLGFRTYIKNYKIFKFITLHLAILDTIETISLKSNGGEVNLVFKDLPIIYEVDRLCEQYNLLLDHIKNYRFTFNTKLKSTCIYSWYYIECFIRIFKLPYFNKVRFNKK